MQNRRTGFFATLEAYIDMAINLLAILASYLLSHLFFEVPQITLDTPWHTMSLLAVLLGLALTYNVFDVYRRDGKYATSFWKYLGLLLRAHFSYFLLLLVIICFVSSPDALPFMLTWSGISLVLTTAFVAFKRNVMNAIRKLLWSKRYALRKVLIVGNNVVGIREYIKAASAEGQGIMIVGYVGEAEADEVECEKLGGFSDFEEVLDKYKPTEVVFAIDAYKKKRIIKFVNMCDDRCIKMYFLPVIFGFFKAARQIEQIGSLPLINIHSTPLDSKFNAFLKRTVDIVGSLLLIIVTSPIMIVAAIGVYVTSPGPVIYRQRRVGRLGKPFTMLKFRSMKLNSGIDWSDSNASKKTRFGAFIRKYAIDELPQLFNVLGGSMSLVGPRPEIPVFVDHFKEQIPLYMVKHYVKPGMTGLAQIKGLRGDTSVEERIHADIDYIENWSFGLDIYILLMTPFKAKNKSEVYIESEADIPTGDDDNDGADLSAALDMADANASISPDAVGEDGSDGMTLALDIDAARAIAESHDAVQNGTENDAPASDGGDA